MRAQASPSHVPLVTVISVVVVVAVFGQMLAAVTIPAARGDIYLNGVATPAPVQFVVAAGVAVVGGAGLWLMIGALRRSVE